MPKPFNIVGRIQLEGPDGLKDIVSTIERELGRVKAKIQIGLNNAITSDLKAIRDSINQLNGSLASVRGQSNSAVQGINQVTTAAAKSASTVKQQAKAFKDTNDALVSSSGGFKRLTNDIEEFGRVSGLAIRRFAGFSIATSLIFGFIGNIRRGISEAITFERQLVKVGQATGNTIDELDPLVNKITELSTSLGVSSQELAGVAQVLSQAGLSARDTKVALEAIAKTDLSPTFRNMAETTEGAIAAMRQFKIGVNDLEEALGSINAVSAAFAVESEDLIAAVQRTGGVFAAASEGIGTPIEQLQQFISIMTSVRQTTRESAESIATGLRTIFTRLQRRSTIDALQDLGVELRDANGEFVGIFETFNRLSQSFQNLSGRSQLFADITEELGGFRQIGKTIPAIRQFSVALEAFNVAQAGGGSLTKDIESAQQSLAVQIAKTREEFLSFIRDLTRTDTFKFLANSVLTFTNALISLGKTIKPLLPILTAFATLKLAQTLISFTRGFRLGLRGKLEDIEAAQDASTKGLPATSLASVNSNTTAVNTNTQTIKSSIGSDNGLIKAIQANVAALAANTAALTGKTVTSAVRSPRLRGRSGGLIAGGGARVRRQTGSGGIERLPKSINVKKFRKPVDLSTTRKTGAGVREFGGIFLLPQNVRSNVSGSFPRTEVGSGKELSGQLKDDLGNDVRFNLSNVSIPGKAGIRFEKRIRAGITKLANNGARNITADLGAQFQPGVFDKAFLEKINIENIVGNIFQGALIAAGAPFDINAPANAPFDFPTGIGSKLADLYGSPALANIPVDAKRSFRRESISSIIGKIRNQLRLENKALKSVEQPQVVDFSKLTSKQEQALKAASGRRKRAGLADTLRGLGFTGDGKDANALQAFARSKGFAAGGSGLGIPALLEPGELIASPSVVRQLGESRLQAANAGNASLLSGITDLTKVPGGGSGDTFPTVLPEGSFVIRRDVADQLDGFFSTAQRFASGGKVRRRRFQTGGSTTVGDSDIVPGGALRQLNQALSALGQLEVQSKELIFVQSKLAEAGTKGTQGINFLVQEILALRDVVSKTVSLSRTVGSGTAFGPGNITEASAARFLRDQAAAGVEAPPVSLIQRNILEDNLRGPRRQKAFDFKRTTQTNIADVDADLEEAPLRQQGLFEKQERARVIRAEQVAQARARKQARLASEQAERDRISDASATFGSGAFAQRSVRAVTATTEQLKEAAFVTYNNAIERGATQQEALNLSNAVLNVQTKKASGLLSKFGSALARGASAVGSVGGGVVGRFGKRIGQQGGIAALVAAPILQQAIGTDTPTRAKIGGGIGGGLAGAVTGFAIGGPIGAAVGGLIGAFTGISGAAEESEKALREQAKAVFESNLGELAKAFQSIDLSSSSKRTAGIGNFIDQLSGASSRVGLGALPKSTIVEPAARVTRSGKVLAGDNFFTQTVDDIGEGRSALAEAEAVAEAQKEYFDQTKALTELINSEAVPRAQAFADSIRSLASGGVDPFKAVQDEANRTGKSFLEVGAALASADPSNAQFFSRFLDEAQANPSGGFAQEANRRINDFLKGIQETELAQGQLAREAAASTRQIDLLALSLSRFGQLATQAAEDVGIVQDNFIKGVLGTTSGQIGGVSAFDPFQRPDIAGRNQLLFGVQQIEQFTGRNELTNSMSQLADVQEELNRDLPLIFQRAINIGGTVGGTGEGAGEKGILQAFDSQFGGGRLPEQVFEGIRRNIVAFFQTRQQENIADVAQELDVEKFADPVIKQLFESGSAIAKAILTIKNSFVESSNEYIKAQLTSAEKQNEIITIQDEFQNRLNELSGITTSTSTVEARGAANVERLARGGGLLGPVSPEAIAARVIDLTSRQGELQTQLEFAGPQDIQPLTSALAQNTLEISSLNGALSEQVKASQSLISAIEKEIAEIQQRKQAGLNVVELLANAATDPAAAIELQKRIQSAAGLLTGGPIAPGGLQGGVGLARELSALFPQNQRRVLEQAINQAQLDLFADDAFRNTDLGQFLQEAVLAPGATGAEQALFNDLARASNTQIAVLRSQEQIALGISDILQNQIAFKLDAQLQELRIIPDKIINGQGFAQGGFAQGGFVGGTFRGNRDTELARVQPGEFVVRRSVAQANASLLEAMNRGGLAFNDGDFVDPFLRRIDSELRSGRRNSTLTRPEMLGLRRRGYTNQQLRDINNRFRFTNRTRRLEGTEILALRRSGVSNQEIDRLNTSFRDNLSRRLRDDDRINQPNFNPVIGVPGFEGVNANRAAAARLGERIRFSPSGVAAELRKKRDKEQAENLAARQKAIRLFGPNVVDRLGPGFFTSPSGKSILSRFNSGGTADSMLAAVTPGEFIVNKAVSTRNRAFLEALNAGRIPAFQNGGVVGRGGSSGVGFDRAAIAAITNLSNALNNLGNLAQIANNLNLVAQQFNKLNIPTRIEVQVAPVQVNVIHNGAEVFATMEPKIAQMIGNQVSRALNQSINPVTGETSSRLV